MAQKHSRIEQAAHLPLIPSKHIISEVVFTGPCILKGFTVKTDGTNNLEAELFDGADTARPLGFVGVVGSDLNGGIMFGSDFIRVFTSIRLVLAGIVGTGFCMVYFNDYDADTS